MRSAGGRGSRVVRCGEYPSGRPLFTAFDGALLAQRAPPSMEIIVPFAPAIDNFESLAREYSTVKFVVMDRLPGGLDPADRSLAHLMYDRKRAVGMASARGRIVAVTEDQMIPDPDWCAALIRNHKLPHGAIGGAVENAGQGALHLALYLFDFGRYQRPFPAGTAVQLTDQNVSYKRAALEKVRHVWAELYDEAGIHKALMDAGESLWISPDCVVRLDRGRLRLRDQLQERFTWGRVFGGKRAQRFSRLKRASMVALSPVDSGADSLEPRGRGIQKRRFTPSHRGGPAGPIRDGGVVGTG